MSSADDASLNLFTDIITWNEKEISIDVKFCGMLLANLAPRGLPFRFSIV